MVFQDRPVPDSNTDLALRIALDATGQNTEFIKLSDYSYQSCRACLGCEETNVCVLNDDATVLAQKIRYADALIVAGHTSYSSLDGRTKSFLERLWQLRHQHGFMRGKPGGIIMTSAIPSGHSMRPQFLDLAISSVKNCMVEEGMDIVGSVGVLGIIPCIHCTPGEHCPMSGIKMFCGSDTPHKSIPIQKLEDQKEVVTALVTMGKEIGKHIEEKQ